jgi:hypothetical protein
MPGGRQGPAEQSLILNGQIGSIVQGADQALCEAVIHDAAGHVLAGRVKVWGEAGSRRSQRS